LSGLGAGCGQTVTPADHPSAASGAATPAIPPIVEQAADRERVSELSRVGPAGINGLGFFSARDASGQDVIAVGSTEMVSPFASRARFESALAESKLYVFTADGGSSLNTVSHRELLGRVAAGITRLDVVLEDGSVRELPLVDHTFVYSSDQQGARPLRVVAYGADGSRVASKALPTPSAPGQD
jgi:hypothetical protein